MELQARPLPPRGNRGNRGCPAPASQPHQELRFPNPSPLLVGINPSLLLLLPSGGREGFWPCVVMERETWWRGKPGGEGKLKMPEVAEWFRRTSVPPAPCPSWGAVARCSAEQIAQPALTRITEECFFFCLCVRFYFAGLASSPGQKTYLHLRLPPRLFRGTLRWGEGVTACPANPCMSLPAVPAAPATPCTPAPSSPKPTRPRARLSLRQKRWQLLRLHFRT